MNKTIKKITVDGLYSISKEELLYLLDVKVGDALDPSKIDGGIRRAFLKGIFQDIQVYEEAQTEGDILLKIEVKERDRIEKISVTGNSYFSARQIKKLFMFKEEQMMRYDLVKDAAGKLERDIAKRGFDHAQTKVESMPTNKPYRVNVTIEVTEGQPEAIKEVEIASPSEEARGLVKLKSGDIYDQIRLKENIEEIKTHYKKKGYFNPSVGPYTFSDGVLNINIDPGKKLIISVEGNSAISEKDLLKEMIFFEAEDFREDLVEESSARIKTLYHGKGYPFVQIAPVVGHGEDSINLRFFIFEGEKITVGSIVFSEATLPEKNLKEIMVSKEGGVYNPDRLDDDRDALEEFYNALGYLAADVREPEVKIENAKAAISIKINEGNQTLLGEIRVEGAAAVSGDEILKAIDIKPGSPYNVVDISDARYRVAEIYMERGFLDSTVDTKQEVGEQGAKITFEIKEGAQTFFGKTIVMGNDSTKWPVFKRDLPYKEGKAFNYSLIAKERQKLYKLGLFTSVAVEPIDKYDSTSDVLVSVKEGNAGAIEFGVGYGDFEKQRGFVDVSYRNLLGMNRQGSVRFEISSLEKRYILNYIEPWFLNRPLLFRALVLGESRTEKNIDTGEISYRLRRQTATAGVEKKFGDHIKGSLYYEFSVVKTFDQKPDVILSKEDTGTLIISALKPGIVYDTRDNPFDPRKGVLAGVTMKVAAGALLSETDFAKLTVSGSYYRELSKRFVLALSLKAGVAQGFASTRELPIVERFFLGGRDTVRGYAQDTLGPKGSDGTPTGGNAFMATNVELRTDLGKGLGLVTFVDGGNVWLNVNQMDLSLKYTAGVGLRYSTPVGPLRVDYGYKLMRETGESHGEIHFSIGQAF